MNKIFVLMALMVGPLSISYGATNAHDTTQVGVQLVPLNQSRALQVIRNLRHVAGGLPYSCDREINFFNSASIPVDLHNADRMDMSSYSPNEVAIYKQSRRGSVVRLREKTPVAPAAVLLALKPSINYPNSYNDYTFELSDDGTQVIKVEARWIRKASPTLVGTIASGKIQEIEKVDTMTCTPIVR